MTLQIVSTAISPVKSGGMLAVPQLVIDTNGIKYDRLFGVARDGKVLTQRELGTLAQIRPLAISQNWTDVEFNGETISLPNYGRAPTYPCTIWESQVQLDVIGAATAWLKKHFGEDLTLVRFGRKAKRMDKRMGDTQIPVKLVDGSQILLINRASLDALNSNLEVAIPAEAFRANIMVTGATAWAEDNWESLKVVGKNIVLRRVGPCFRCEITTHNPATGEKTGKEPLRWLGHNRRIQYNYPDLKMRTGAAFGMYYHIDARSGETIANTDELELIE